MSGAVTEVASAQTSWGVVRVVSYSALISACYLGAGVVSVIGVGIADALTDPGIDIQAWAARAGSDGFILGVSTLAAAVTCIPLVRWLVGRREAEPWSYLGFRPCSVRSLLGACAAMGLFVAVSDGLTLALGRPVVPEFSTLTYASARSHVLLWTAFVVAAPLVEEVIFRGFFLSTLRSLRLPDVASALLVSLMWAAVHVQYDLYGMATILAMGLLYAAVRIRLDSLLPTIAMHGLTNAVAFVQAMMLAPA